MHAWFGQMSHADKRHAWTWDLAQLRSSLAVLEVDHCQYHYWQLFRVLVAGLRKRKGAEELSGLSRKCSSVNGKFDQLSRREVTFPPIFVCLLRHLSKGSACIATRVSSRMSLPHQPGDSGRHSVLPMQQAAMVWPLHVSHMLNH